MGQLGRFGILGHPTLNQFLRVSHMNLLSWGNRVIFNQIVQPIHCVCSSVFPNIEQTARRKYCSLNVFCCVFFSLNIDFENMSVRL